MNEFASITDVQALKVFFYVESVILVMAVGIIGFFFRKRDDASIMREVAVTEATNGLTNAVQQLKIVVNNLQLQYEIRQPLLDAQIELFKKTFSESATIIKNIDSRLIKLETEHRLFHCQLPASNITINNHESTPN